LRQNKCGPGQPPEPHVRGAPDSPFSTAKRRDDVYPRATLESAAFGFTDGAFAISGSQDPTSRPRHLCCCQRPRRSKSNLGKRPQRPGHRPRAHARFWNIPRQFTLVNRRLPLALPQSSGKLQELTFDVSTLLPPFPHRNRKHAHACEQPVDEAPSLWKLEEKWKINQIGRGRRCSRWKNKARDSLGACDSANDACRFRS
jgi:hypothetical protein